MADSIFLQALKEVAARVRGLGITGVPRGQVQVRKFPWDNNIIHKGITIHPMQEDEFRPGESTNERDTIGYPIGVTYVRGSDRGWESDLGTITDFRQKVRREFSNKRLLEVIAEDSNHIICKVDHGTPVIPDKYIKSHNASQMVIVCWFLEPRVNF